MRDNFRKIFASVLAEGAGGGASSLLTNLVAYWKLDEASDGSGAVARVDSVGGLSLTDTNTVASAVGKVGNGAQFVAANTEYMYIADNPALSAGLGVDFSLAAWFYPTTNPAGQAIAGKYGSGTNEYMLNVQSQDACFTGSNGGAPVVARTTGGVVAGSWYWLLGEYDATAELLKISINNGTPATATLANGIQNGTSPFAIGAFGVGVFLSYYVNGIVDEVGVWKRLLTTAEKASLYNGGAGLSYPF